MMTKKLTFTKIENGTIFQPEFSPFDRNNIVNFSPAGIAVIYGPNGTGKTSLAKAMAGVNNTNIECIYETITYSNGQDLFYVINDQNNRNIIQGTTQDFLLGSDIKREFELSNKLSEQFTEIKNWLITSLKNDYTISSASNKLISLIKNQKLTELVRDLANSRSKGKHYSIEKLINIVSNIKPLSEPNITDDKWSYFIKHYGDDKTVLMNILKLSAPDLSKNKEAATIEEDNIAINILNQFHHKSNCIVCDTTDINPKSLIERKTSHRQTIINSLSEQMRSFIEDVLALSSTDDPFNIKNNVLEALNVGDFTIIQTLQTNIRIYADYFDKKINLLFSSIPDFVAFNDMFNEYQDLISKKPDISEEDFIYIQEIISNSMNKKIAVHRDKNKNLKILLNEHDFIGIDRDNLPLSTGEQNFLSLCFEFLKAKNTDAKIIVMDDPISSFDSIYKNKIVFAIIKILEKKQRIILTHNIDLLRLLQAQYKNSFTLFLLNNTAGEDNGIIPLTSDEQDMLINLKILLDTFRYNIYPHIREHEIFLMSMIPFMRGYANIIGRKEESDKLTNLMHGYMTKPVNVSEIFFELFGSKGKDFLPTAYTISVDDILKQSVDTINILDSDKYPLLDKTLRHALTYLFLRLHVEKTLVAKYKINTSKHDQLGAIINQAFPGQNPDSVRNRVRLTSKKTLINEFNHFEGNLSIFQPAIDITEDALSKEKNDILNFIRIITKTR